MSKNIYTYIENNFNIKITNYIFKRDYILNHLQKIPRKTGGVQWENPYKEDLEYLYLILNLRIIDLSKLFNVKLKILYNWIKIFNIYKPTYLRYQNIEKTCLSLYNATNVFSNDSKIIKNIHHIIKEKYNVENVFQLNFVKEKSKKTNIQKYGVDNYTKSNEYKIHIKTPKILNQKIQKEYITKKKNNTFCTSQPENEIYNLLQNKFKEVIRQYKSELYPFSCDFYIPSIDLYIEYQGWWGHGKEPYIGSDGQKEKVKLWESKSHEFNSKGKLKKQYTNAINTWLKKDILKRNTAKDNNLNWIEFFNMNQFMELYSKQ